jgi:hypothetical protein
MKKIIIAGIAFIGLTSISCTKECECKNVEGEVIMTMYTSPCKTCEDACNKHFGGK